VSVDRRAIVLLVVAGVAVLGVLLFGVRIPQWPEYHDFADQRTLAGIPNAMDVLSNLAILIVGVWGTLFVLTRKGARTTGPLQPNYLAFFAGIALTALGSAYYHLSPDNATLVWDRMPMTIVFVGLLTIVIGELISPRAAWFLLMPLLAVGAASVAWWAMTEQAGNGDLRPYALVQFLSPVLILLMLGMYPHSRGMFAGLTWLGGVYALAKICELYDLEILQTTGFVSGHTLKHIVAAAGTAGILVMLFRRGQWTREPANS
jgi:hypothetical protein